MNVPFWALTLAYWLHMLATVAWMGGLAALTILVLPAARKALAAPAYLAFLGEVQRRLDPLAWFCLALLGGTGLLQMSASPNYQGFLAIQGRWATAILLKHLVFLGMAGLSAYLSWGLLPRLRRLALLQARGRKVDEREASGLQQQEAWLLRLNLFLGVLVLALTAVARAA
ncbi:MAG: CopD family protein [Chloroflexota bacterium]